MAELQTIPCDSCHRTLKTFVSHQIKTCCVCNYERQKKNKFEDLSENEKQQEKLRILRELGLL